MIQLIRYDAACQAIAIARKVDEVKDIRDKAEAVRAYAKQANNKQLEADALEIRKRAERRAGELLTEMKETGERQTRGSTGGGRAKSEAATLQDIGVTKDQSSEWQKLAAIPEEKFETHLAGWREDILEGRGKTANLIVASESNEWYTPKKYIEAAREVLDGIDLDPASCEMADSIVKARAYYAIDDDGLSKDWSGNVWLNPPYGDAGPRFIKKLIEQYESKKIDSGIVLLNSHSTDAGWFQPLWDYALCFTDHRIDFYKNGEQASSSTHGNVFIYLGPKQKKFSQVFSEFGAVVKKYG